MEGKEEGIRVGVEVLGGGGGVGEGMEMLGWGWRVWRC